MDSMPAAAHEVPTSTAPGGQPPLRVNFTVISTGAHLPRHASNSLLPDNASLWTAHLMKQNSMRLPNASTQKHLHGA